LIGLPGFIPEPIYQCRDTRSIHAAGKPSDNLAAAFIHQGPELFIQGIHPFRGILCFL
jgi:hypothetical protein